MRILLVQAFTALDLELVYPIGLSYLAAHLPEGHVVEIFDVNLYRDEADPYAVLGNKVREFQPDVVGISLRNIKVATPGLHNDDFEPQQRSVRVIRAEAPKAKIVAGGTAFSLFGLDTKGAYGHLGLSTVVVYADPARDLAVVFLNTGKPMADLGMVRWYWVLQRMAATFPRR